MTISLNDLVFLSSASGENLLARLAGDDLSEANTLRLLTALRKDYPAEQARAALEMARLRLKAVEKFGEDAQKMFFTRDALEQASDPLVRSYRAKHLSAVPELVADEKKLRIIDACCGIGADALAFARTGADVLGLDIDPVRVEIARHNAAALGINARFETADVRDGLPEADIVFFDPARRDDTGKRIYNVEHYQPPLSVIHNWTHPLVVVKLSPGIDRTQVESYGGCIEFISVNGDLKESVLWRGTGFTGLKATLLSVNDTQHWIQPNSLQPQDADLKIRSPHGWLIEPDSALMRAGLVQEVAAAFHGHMLDETIAYFTTESRPKSPWLRAWHILDWMPFNVKKLRAYLRELHVGNVTVKKRGSPITPEELIPQLKLEGSESRTLVLTRYRGNPIVLICANLTAEDAG
ncbi:MAG: methyltransferase domain-containing protein [Anaerolineae bacterium]|nr:methyltransferase domain-containing protein [Anaerolineae bacterium]